VIGGLEMKKIMSFLVAMAIFLSLTGCANMLEEEYLSIEEHSYTSPENDVTVNVVEVSNYKELLDSIINMIAEYSEEETVRFTNYSGDIENDVADVCVEIMNNTPIGAYSTYYVGYTINKFVSYYEAEISIIYKKTEEQVVSVIKAEDDDDVKNELEQALRYNMDYIALDTKSENITKEIIVDFIKDTYYENPEYAIIMPEITVSVYPEDGDEHIVEAEMEYPYIDSLMSAMQSRLDSKIQVYKDELAQENDYMKLEKLCSMIYENVVCDNTNMTEENYAATDAMNTAYSALVSAKASSEGIAMAVKMICDSMNIECYVVIGKLDDNVHAWNIVDYNGNYYHLDASRYGNGIFLVNDEEIKSNYWWDTSAFPKCVATIGNVTNTVGEDGNNI
jgi:hypothetical protein